MLKAKLKSTDMYPVAEPKKQALRVKHDECMLVKDATCVSPVASPLTEENLAKHTNSCSDSNSAIVPTNNRTRIAKVVAMHNISGAIVLYDCL